MSYLNKLRVSISRHTTEIEEESCKKKDYSNNQRIRWSPDEDKKLKAYLSIFGHRWLKIAQEIGNRNASQCCQRWKRIKKVEGFESNKAKRWTQNEDETLLRIYKQVGPLWNLIAQKMKQKTNKQVRRRYTNFLDPKLNHGPITDAEDEIIYNEYLKYGSQWSKISTKIPGRSENMVKNRFYSCIKQKYLNQPNLYFKVKPLEKIEMRQDVDLFQEDQIHHEFQELDNQDLYNDSNQIVDNNQSSFYWGIESKGNLFHPLR